MPEPNPEIMPEDHFKERITFLEDLNRWHLMALDIFSSISQLYLQGDTEKTPFEIFEQTAPYTKLICGFDQIGFCGIDEKKASFHLIYTDTQAQKNQIGNDLEQLIDNGDFAWALNLTEPTITVLRDKTIVLTPIATPSRIRGMFIGYLKEMTEFESRHKRGLTAIIHNCAYAIESSELQNVIRDQNQKLVKAVVSQTKKLEYQHNHNQLTRLPNRASLKDAVSHAINRCQHTGHLVVVILIDLDMFKRVNESFGHSAGDELLRQVSARLTKNMRVYDSIAQLNHNNPKNRSNNSPDTNPNDAPNNTPNNTLNKDVNGTSSSGPLDDSNANQISHFGGDEFCILLGDVTSLNDVKSVLNRIQNDLSLPFAFGAHQIIQNFSAGISISPDNGKNAEQLIQCADVALYQAKSKGRNQCIFYTPSMKKETLHHLDLSAKLYKALEKDQFKLHYQPQINTKTLEIIGLEALIRWVDENNDTIPPNHFIPMAEELGLVIPIGDWVIREACGQIKILQDHGFNDIPIAVNIAAQQFAQENFLTQVLEVIQEAGIQPDLLEIELTERVIMDDVEETIKSLNNLHDFGIKISVDDFGTGYSSLSYLKRFPIDTLKIDKSFIDDVAHSSDDAAIVTAIAALAKSLHLNIIAEGVETENQVSFLDTLDCFHVQGFLYSKPLNQDQLISFLNENKKLHLDKSPRNRSPKR